MITIFPPEPPVATTFVLAAPIAVQNLSKKDQCDTNYRNTFGTEEYSNQPQRVTFNKRLVNVLTFEMEYEAFPPFKRDVESVCVEAWDLYTKQVTDNLIPQCLQKFSTEKLATSATEDTQINI